MVKKNAVKQNARKGSAGKKTAAAKPKRGAPSTPARAGRAKVQAVPKRSVPAKPVEVVPSVIEAATRKKGVRKATLTTGIRNGKPAKTLGRSRIPVDAPLDVVFQNDLQAREAFMFLGVHTIRELEQFQPDDLVMRLTSPAKQTVGRIRKILAMNNRCLEGDEAFALEYQEQHSGPTPPTPVH